MTDVRSVLRLGHSSVGLSLPVEWARRVGAVPGTAVEVTAEADGSLRLRVAPAGARPTFVGVRLETSVPCPGCGLPIGVDPSRPRGYTKGRFYKHGRDAHAGLGAFGVSELADKWVRAVRLAVKSGTG